MPQPKGKRKSKRLRRRLGMLGGEGPGSDTSAIRRTHASGSTPMSRPRKSAGPIMRKGWQPPFWVNASFGVILLIMGIIFFATIGKKSGGNTAIIMLLAYCALGGFYLARAVRQFREKQGH